MDPNDEACLDMLAGAHFGPNAGVVLPSGRRLDADEAQALTSFYASAVGEGRPSDAERRAQVDRHSPMGMYLAGGGDLSGAPSRTQEILRLAEESYHRRAATPPPASPPPRRRWWQRKPGAAGTVGG